LWLFQKNENIIIGSLLIYLTQCKEIPAALIFGNVMEGVGYLIASTLD
jgi:hypothetical protein